MKFDFSPETGSEAWKEQMRPLSMLVELRYLILCKKFGEDLILEHGELSQRKASGYDDPDFEPNTESQKKLLLKAVFAPGILQEIADFENKMESLATVEGLLSFAEKDGEETKVTPDELEAIRAKVEQSLKKD